MASEKITEVKFAPKETMLTVYRNEDDVIPVARLEADGTKTDLTNWTTPVASISVGPRSEGGTETALTAVKNGNDILVTFTAAQKAAAGRDLYWEVGATDGDGNVHKFTYGPVLILEERS